VSQTLVVLHLRAQGLEEGDEHPYGEHYLYLYLTLSYMALMQKFLSKNLSTTF